MPAELNFSIRRELEGKHRHRRVTFRPTELDYLSFFDPAAATLPGLLGGEPPLAKGESQPPTVWQPAGMKRGKWPK